MCMQPLPILPLQQVMALQWFIGQKAEWKEWNFISSIPLHYIIRDKSFLNSEAVRGFGAILKTVDGNEFMQKYDKRKSLAPRDITARAIDNEMKIRGDDYVYLDCRHLDKEELLKHFPNIYEKCLSIGIDIHKDFIPVMPAAHYMCGGIKVDKKGKSNIKHLYAVGECSSTGLHGANRSASNSLLEAVVYAHHAAMDAIEEIKTIEFCDLIPDWNAEGTASRRDGIACSVVTGSSGDNDKLCRNSSFGFALAARI